MEPLRIVSIAFHTAGKIFDFDAKDFKLLPGDQVIVETERGRALGTVITKPREISPGDAPPRLKAVVREASESDLQMADGNTEREKEALKFCQQKVQQRKLEMKLVRAEYLFDGSKIIFYFTADGRIDFRELVRDLAQHFRTRIEMRQIGVRDEAKLVGGIGICGRELCCCSHLREFAPVSVKMAKAQGLALNPTKISGQCGRLLCCLAYEYDTYNNLKKNLPKCGKKLQLKDGKAEVIALDILSQKVTLACHNGERCQMHIDQLQNELDQDHPPGAKSGEQSTESKTGKKKESKPPQSQDRKTKDQRRSASHSKQTQGEAKPGGDTRQSKQNADQDVAKDGAQEKKKTPRRRRRPRRRSNRPQKPDNKS